jgi:hypothetical protein
MTKDVAAFSTAAKATFWTEFMSFREAGFIPTLRAVKGNLVMDTDGERFCGVVSWDPGCLWVNRKVGDLLCSPYKLWRLVCDEVLNEGAAGAVANPNGYISLSC